MAKIFQLELFIKDVSLWKLPRRSEEWDDTLLEFNLFDIKNVSYCIDGFEEGSVKDRGQNFLFTLYGIPSNKNNMHVNIFKKGYQKPKKYLGTGVIPIQEIFEDVFIKTFDEPKKIAFENVIHQETDDTTASKSTDATNAKPSKNDSRDSQKRQSSAGKVPKTPTNKKDSQNSVKGKQTSPTNGKASDKENDKKNPINEQEGTGAKNTDDSSTTLNKKLEAKAEIMPRRPPISKLSKDIFPIVGPDSNQWGMVCMLMRLTSFGSFSAHQIHVHENHEEIIIQNTPNTAMYKRVQLNDLRNNILTGTGKHPEHFGYISSFPSVSAKNKLIYDQGPKLNDFNFQCNESDIAKDVLEYQKRNDDVKAGANYTSTTTTDHTVNGGKSGKVEGKKKK